MYDLLGINFAQDAEEDVVSATWTLLRFCKFLARYKLMSFTNLQSTSDWIELERWMPSIIDLILIHNLNSQ